MPKNRKNNEDVFKRHRKLLSSGLFSNNRESGQYEPHCQDLSTEEVMAIKWGEQETHTLLEQFKNVDHEVIHDVLNMCNGDVTKAASNLKEMIGVTQQKKRADPVDLATIACSLLSYEAFGNGEVARDLDSPDLSERVTDSSINERGSVSDTDYFGNTYDFVTCSKKTFLRSEARPPLQQHNGIKNECIFDAASVGINGDAHSWPVFTSSNPYSVGGQSYTVPLKPPAVSSHNLKLFPKHNEGIVRTKEKNATVGPLNPTPGGRLISAPVNRYTILDEPGTCGHLSNGHLSYDEWGAHHSFTLDPEAFLKDFTTVCPDKNLDGAGAESCLPGNLEFGSAQTKKRNRHSRKKKNPKAEGKNSNENVVTGLEPVLFSHNLVFSNEEELPAEPYKMYGLGIVPKHLLTNDDQDRSRERLEATIGLVDKYATLLISPITDETNRLDMFSQGAELPFASPYTLQQVNPLLSSPGVKSTIQSKSAVKDKSIEVIQVSKKSPKKRNTILQSTHSDQLKTETLSSDQTQFENHNELATFDPVDPLGWNDVFKVHLGRDPPKKRSSVIGQVTDKRQHKSQSKSVPPWAESPVQVSVLTKPVSELKSHTPSSQTVIKSAPGKKRPVLVKPKEEKVAFMDHQLNIEAETCVIKPSEDLVNGHVPKGPPQWMKGFMPNALSGKQQVPPVSNVQTQGQIPQKTDPSPAPLADLTGVCKNRLNLLGVKSPVSIIHHYILEKQPVMVILRGLPGSGKSYLARQLIAEANKMGVQGIVLSTDDYFMQGGAYVFEKNDLTIAHDWNSKRALTYVTESKSPIIIDNTNTCLWEFLPYAELALSYKYDVQIFEPDTDWKVKVAELSRKNSHGVAKEHIRRMKVRYQQVTLEALLKAATESLKKKDFRSKHILPESVQESRRIPLQETAVQNLNIEQHKASKTFQSTISPGYQTLDTTPAGTQPGRATIQPKSSSAKPAAPWCQPTDSLLATAVQQSHRIATADKSGLSEVGAQESFSEWCRSKDKRTQKPKKKAEASAEKVADRSPKKITKTYLSSALKEAWVNIWKDKHQAGLQEGNLGAMSNAHEISTFVQDVNMFGNILHIHNESPEIWDAGRANEMAEPVSITEDASSSVNLAMKINDGGSMLDGIDDYSLTFDDVEKGSQFGDSCSTSESFITCCSEHSIVSMSGDETGRRLGQESLLHIRSKSSPPRPMDVNVALSSSTEDILGTPDTVINALQFNREIADGRNVVQICNTESDAQPGISSTSLVGTNCTGATSEYFDQEGCSAVTSSSSSFSVNQTPGSSQGRTNIFNTDSSVQKIFLSSPLVSYSDSEGEEFSTLPDADDLPLRISEECQIKEPALLVNDNEGTLLGEHAESKGNSESSSSREETPQSEQAENVSPMKQSKKKRIRKGRNSEPFIADSLKAKSKNESWSNFYKQHTDCLTSSEDPLCAETTISSDVSMAAVLETRDSCSQCEPYIFSLLYKLNSSVFNILQPIDLCHSDVTVVTASKDFRLGPGSFRSDAGVPMKYGTVDTSTNTDESLEREEVDLETLVSCFPEYSKRELEEVMSLYGKDIELVSSYLLEAPAYSDLVEEENAEERHYLEKQPVNKLKSLAEMCSSIAREKNQMDQDDLEMKVILAGENRLQKIESFSRSRLLSSEKGQCYDSWQDCLVLEDFTGVSSANENLFDSSHPQYGSEPPDFIIYGYEEKSPTSGPPSDSSAKDNLNSYSLYSGLSGAELSKSVPEDQSAVSEDWTPQSMPVLPSSFIKSLENLFGPLNLQTGSHDLTLDDLTARKIFNCLKLSSAKKVIVDNTEKQLKDDEALARALQEKEDARMATESAKRVSLSVPGWTNHRPPWMHQGGRSPSGSGMKSVGGSKQSPQLNRSGSVADTLHLLRGTDRRKAKPFKFQMKMQRVAAKSVWSEEKRRNQADSLLSIMEEEKAREEQQREQMRLIELTGDSQALATRLKRMELSNLYPSLGPDFLEEIFMNTGYSMEETVRTLETAYGISPAPMSKERQDEILEQMKERSREEYYRQFVGPDDVYDQYSDAEDVSWSYEDLRHEADVYHKLAKECKDQANRYQGDGMPSAALFYRQKYKDYKEREYNANHKAAEILFEKGRERLAKENTLDLHFYHLDEALIAVNKAISLMEAEYHQRPDKKSTYLNVVTGRGRNSKDGKPILKPAVINHFRDRCFRFEERSPGMLRVYIGQRL